MPQLFAQVDRTKAKTLGVSLNEVFGSLQAYLGSAYVNDFNRFGRTWQVKVQADHRFRLEPEDIRQLEVRNAAGQMVPIGTLVDVDYVTGAQTILRYNLYPAASITGQAAPGFSSGQALKLMEDMATTKLPASMGYEWTGISFQEKQVGNEAIVIFALAIVLVFLVLAAQYESWTSPAAVILVVPLAVLGTVGALLARGFDNNVYTQIGIVLLIGLASKNAILIVEFAQAEREKGLGSPGSGARGRPASLPADPDDGDFLDRRVHARWSSPPARARRAGRPSAPPWSDAWSPPPSCPSSSRRFSTW